MAEYIFGKNPVLEAVRMQFPVRRILLAKGSKKIADVTREIQKARPGLPVEIVERNQLEKLAQNARSGGIGAEITFSNLDHDLDTFLGHINSTTERPILLAADSIHDPRNFGAIVRSAVGAGFHGIIFPKDRQAGLTGTVAATSAGACFKTRFCRVVNLARTLDELKRHDFWVYGTGTEGAADLYQERYAFPLVLVIGSEEKGMRPLIAKKCDHILSIPLKHGLESLNASVAAGIAMFEIARQYPAE